LTAGSAHPRVAIAPSWLRRRLKVHRSATPFGEWSVGEPDDGETGSVRFCLRGTGRPWGGPFRAVRFAPLRSAGGPCRRRRQGPAAVASLSCSLTSPSEACAAAARACRAAARKDNAVFTRWAICAKSDFQALSTLDEIFTTGRVALAPRTERRRLKVIRVAVASAAVSRRSGRRRDRLGAFFVVREGGLGGRGRPCRPRPSTPRRTHSYPYARWRAQAAGSR
jgi:hypothetical protein